MYPTGLTSLVLFVDKARSQSQSGAPERCFTWVGSGITSQTLEKVGKACYGANTSLLRTFVNYNFKQFYDIGPGWKGWPWANALAYPAYD